MTALPETVRTTTLVGQREDLEDVIYRVAAEQTPWLSNIGTATAKARLHEWQLEDIAAADPDGSIRVEGDEFPANTAAQNTVRVGNFQTIFAYPFGIARTADIVDKAGRETETARQKILFGIRMNRDCEARAIGNFASQNESGANPRKFGGALAWLTTNASRGAGGADGGFSAGIVAAATNGTQRAFTETLVRETMAMLFTSRGGSAGDRYQAYMSGPHKQTWSQFTGIAAIQTQTGEGIATIIGAADTYLSDFGRKTLIPHPYGLTRDVLIADPKYWAMAPLQGMRTWNLAKTGDSDRYLQTKETTLVCRNEKASAVIADLL